MINVTHDYFVSKGLASSVGVLQSILVLCLDLGDRLCGLVVRVSGYRYRGPGFDPRRYQIF